MMKRKVQVWLLLMAAVLVFLWLTSTRTAYASDDGVGTESITPGEGGGLTNAVAGFIDDEAGSPVVGMYVYLYADYVWPLGAVTDSRGFFMFHDPYSIHPNSFYHISVNGEWLQLGVECLDKTYGQWYGAVQTDNKGVAWKFITLQRAAIVDVPAAAIFSNTQYATVYYGTQTSQGFSHSLSFSVPILGISVGYKTSENVAYTALFWSLPNHSQYINRPYYASTYFDDTVGNIVATGITHEVPNTWWGGLSTHEYLNKTRLPTTEYVDFPVPPGGQDWTYQETGSTTWSANFDVPFAIIYEAFSRLIKIDITVTSTSGTTTWVRYRIENPTENDIYFRVYTPGAQPNQNNRIGGMELHVWQL